MGDFRFRRRFRILPGLTLNLGKRSASVSVGVRGAHVTVGPTATRTTVGVPGTGLSYTTTSQKGRTHEPASQPQVETPTLQGSAVRGWLWIALVIAVLAVVAVTMTGCGEEKKVLPPEHRFIEYVKVEGTCSEDHARVGGRYAGSIVDWYNITTNRHDRYGSVTDFDSMSVERLKQHMADEYVYTPPFIISFRDLSTEAIAGTALTLHGISKRVGETGGGFWATCQLAVTERLDHLPPTTPAARRN